MDRYRRAIKNAIKKSSKGLIDSLAVERCPTAVEIALKQFLLIREKHRYECNQACYTTKDPNNILSSQNHLSTRKKNVKLIDPKHTHTHTKQV